jgi:ABC-2 type transport system ATP-binding protein
MDAVLQVAGARKRFGAKGPGGGVLALDGVDLALRQGEWVGLLGPNGAGKTTLVRAIAGRVRLDEGRITLLGRDLGANGSDQGDQGRARLGIVPQEIALYGLLTPVENLRTFGALYGLRGGDLRERIEWAMAWTGLEDRANARVATFSGGMKRRLNIACAVLHRPEVVLLDEPTVGVDPQSRERIWEMLAGLRAAGASLMLTTHQLDEAQRVCDRIIIIDHGRVIADGRLDELVARTVGPGRRVRLTLDREADAAMLGAERDGDGRTLVWRVSDVAAELAAALDRVRAAGYAVEDVHVEAPSLHAVFIHLTGRELRE